jgi:hypothetical protein
VAPVNRVPPEILALVPDFWDKHYNHRDRDLIALTHVCQAWREAFTSRSSLWTDLDCRGEDKTRVYLERSKYLPINLSLYTEDRLPAYHPFFKIIRGVIGRLGSLSIEVLRTKHLQRITDHLSLPAPLLEKLSICGGLLSHPRRNPVLPPALLNGDLSSLRSLSLSSVRTELPWRNMVHLTSFELYSTSSGEVTIRQLLDFFEGAPRLRKIHLCHATPTSGAQNGRLVSLACLEWMEITSGGSASLFLGHMLIPVGAYLKIEVDLLIPPIKDHPPRFLDNLRNFPDFTAIELCGDIMGPHMQFSGLNGRVRVVPSASRVDKTRLMLESLDQFDTSKVERLEIDRGHPSSSDPLYRALLPMEHLRTLTLCHCPSPHTFVHALHPDMSSSGVVVCPELDELVIMLEQGKLDMGSIIGVVAARASSGTKLRSIRIIGDIDKPVWTDVLELRKHVLRVEYHPDLDYDIDEEY